LTGRERHGHPAKTRAIHVSSIVRTQRYGIVTETALGHTAGHALTGRELEVAELIAAGLTNQAIARRLSVAPRTAEAHV
jgi:DNA-binding NarL/FixJ family response regulator